MNDNDYFADLATKAKTVAINTATSGDNTLHTTTAGRRFCVLHIFIEAEGAVDVTFKSGATTLTGAINFGANDEKEWKNDGVPVIRGNAVGDNFIINLGGNVQVNGFAVLVEVTT